MAPPLYVKQAFIVQIGAGGFQVNRKSGFCKHSVDIRNDSRIFNQKLRKTADFVSKFRQNPLYFFALLQNKLSELIVQIDNGDWLDIQCRACCRLIVNNSLNIAFIFLLDGYNVSVVSQGDDVVLKIFGNSGRPRKR